MGFSLETTEKVPSGYKLVLPYTLWMYLITKYVNKFKGSMTYNSKIAVTEQRKF